MKRIRQNLLICTSLAASVILGATAAAQQKIDVTRAAAVVNGEVVNKGQVEGVVRMMTGGEGDTSAGSAAPEKQKQMRQIATAMLIDDALWRQAMSKQMPQPSQQELSRQMVEFEETLKKQGKTLQQFCTETAQNINQVQNAMVCVLQWGEFVKRKATDDVLHKYYDDYKDFFEGNMVDVSHIVIRVSPRATEAERKAALEKINALRQDIVTGKIDFVKAAEQSQCESAKQGGRIGPIQRKWGWFDETFTRAAFDPTLQVGAVTPVVQTEYGYHIIRLNERKPGKPTTFEAVKNVVREHYQEDLRQEIIAQLRKSPSTKIDIDRDVVETLP
jgi:parvulin-like peptidyl-prolyl isomerase